MQTQLIVKIQAPSNKKNNSALISDQKELSALTPYGRFLKNLIPRGEIKFFFAEYVNEKLVLGEEAPPQDW